MTDQASTEHEDMVNDCLARDSRLTEWEQDFMRNVHEQLEGGRTLTPKQAERLDAIWERVTA